MREVEGVELDVDWYDNGCSLQTVKLVSRRI